LKRHWRRYFPVPEDHAAVLFDRIDSKCDKKALQARPRTGARRRRESTNNAIKVLSINIFQPRFQADVTNNAGE
jgi:hypothetical protein